VRLIVVISQSSNVSAPCDYSDHFNHCGSGEQEEATMIYGSGGVRLTDAGSLMVQ